MASRYSGTLKISVKVNPSSDGWDVNVSEAGKHLYRCSIGQPPASRVAVDAPEAFDGAASSALAFMENDGGDTSGALVDADGYVIRRMR
jgi:hypothetical protein